MGCQSSDFALIMFVRPPPTYHQTYFIAPNCEQFHQSLPPRCSSPSSWIAQSLPTQEQWLSNYPALVALAGTQIFWATEVGAAFSRLEKGYEGAVKEYYKRQIDQLNMLISLLIGKLSKDNRQKVMTICNIDVH